MFSVLILCSWGSVLLHLYPIYYKETRLLSLGAVIGDAAVNIPYRSPSTYVQGFFLMDSVGNRQVIAFVFCSCLVWSLSFSLMLGLKAGMHFHSWQIGVFLTLLVIPKCWPGCIPFGPRASVTSAPILPDLFFSALWPQANNCMWVVVCPSLPVRFHIFLFAHWSFSLPLL